MIIPKISGIYKITSPSGKIYIGKATNLNIRHSKYKGLHCKQQYKIHRSLQKYGFDAHKFEIIEECSINRLDELEMWYKLCCVIDMGWSKCLFFNIIDGKGGAMGEEQKLKISLSNTGQKRTEEQKLRLHLCKIGNTCKAGTTVSDSSKEKMSKSALGKKKSEEHKQNMSKAKLNNPPQYWKGKKFSEEHKAKLRKPKIKK